MAFENCKDILDQFKMIKTTVNKFIMLIYLQKPQPRQKMR